jgi:hypothetical protein
MDFLRNTRPNEMPLRQKDNYGRASVGMNYMAERSTLNGPTEEEVNREGRNRGSYGYRAESYLYPPPSSLHSYGRYDNWVQNTGTSSRGLNRSDRSDEFSSYRSSSSPRDQYGSSGRGDTPDYYGGKSTGFACHPSVGPDIPSLVGSDTSSFENSWDEGNWNKKCPEPYAEGPYTMISEEDKFMSFRTNEDEENAYHEQSSSRKLPASMTLFKTKENSRTGMKTIEVSPGEHLRLRGADETWRAVQVDFYMPCECMCCSLTIFCIQDAACVLCPECRVVSPMVGASTGSDGGVGLGFTIDDLASWQEEIRISQKHRNYK